MQVGGGNARMFWFVHKNRKTIYCKGQLTVNLLFVTQRIFLTKTLRVCFAFKNAILAEIASDVRHARHTALKVYTYRCFYIYIYIYI